MKYDAQKNKIQIRALLKNHVAGEVSQILYVYVNHTFTFTFFLTQPRWRPHSGYYWKEGPNGWFLGLPTPHEVAEWLRVTASSA